MLKRLICSAIVYLAIFVAFAIIFSDRFGMIVHVKGDDFFYTLYFMVGLTYILSVYWYFSVFRKSPLFFLIFPIDNSLISFIAGFFLLYLFSIKGIPSQVIRLYSLTYGGLTLLSLFIFYWRIRTNKPPIILSRKAIFTRTFRS
jgi:hypothetical protein